MWAYPVCIITGLEYKFMVKSVDPDGTTAVTSTKNEPGDVVISLSRDLSEAGKEEDEYGDWMEELTSPAPVILGEKGILPNHTGTNHNHATTCSRKLILAKSKPLVKHTDV